MVSFVPNALTCGNLICGCIAIVEVQKGNLTAAALLTAIAALLDFFDGFAARMLKVFSELGKQLDSLADGVTFGVLPAMVMFKLMCWSLNISGNPSLWEEPLPYLAFIIAVFSVLRLAKFNIDTRQSESFIGVPTPANSILINAIPLILMYQSDASAFLQQQNYTLAAEASILLNFKFLLFLTLLLSYLLVAELPLFAMKFKHFNWKGNEIRYIFLVSALLLLICFKFVAIPIIIILYVLLSLLNLLMKKNNS